MRDILLLASLLMCLQSAFGQSNGEQFARANGFSLGTSNLLEVQQKLGPSRLVAAGDGGDYEESICYKARTGFFYFLAGEMSGSDHGLIGFGASANDRNVPCSQTAKRNHLLDTKIARIRLGMTRQQFEKVIDASVKWEKDVALAFYLNKRPMTPTEISALPADIRRGLDDGTIQNYYDVSISIKGVFKRGKLDSYKVWKVESL